MDELLGEFLAETIDGLATLDSHLILLEHSPGDHTLIGSIFRVVHTLKGTCGFFSLPRLEALAHACENLLGQLRDKKLQATPDVISLILKTADRVRTILLALEATETEPQGDDSVLICDLNAFVSGTGSQPVLDIKDDRPNSTPELDIEAEGVDTLPDTTDVSASAASVRVHVDLLENLMTMVSELVLTRNQLMQILRSEKDSVFSTPLQRLSHLTSELQEGVMRTRMQPIRNAWVKLPRLVRDLSIDLGKKIDLKLSGADTELDRQVLELIKDPLIHIVRNCIDHGLETPAARLAAGKTENGTISLNAYHDGTYITVDIADDGRGLDTGSIRQKIIQKGLIGVAELDQMSAEQIHQFIFKPGFSTAEQVTNISGRGVGMDVVLSNIEKISGTVELKSRAGHGTAITIKIPLTLSIIPVLIVEACGMRFAIPQSGVEELVLPQGRAEIRIETLNGNLFLRLRDNLISLVSLSALLGLETSACTPDESHIVVTRVGGESFGIIVDDVYDCEEIVVKPVARIMRHIPLYSGNTILGDGSVIMILDPGGIASAIGMTSRQLEKSVENNPANQQEDTKKLSFFVFKAGGETLKATPLGQITRLEEFDRQDIEYTNNRPVIQYRGRLMPLVPVDPDMRLEVEGTQQVLVFSDEQRCMGLLVDQIIDIVEDDFDIQFGSERPGFLGSAVIGGRATDLIDTGYYLTQAYADWFVTLADQRLDVLKPKRRILLLDDSQLFRHLAMPVLKLAGYDVCAVGSVDRAFVLYEERESFDAIITDIEMPDKSGFDFAQALPSMTRWRDIPIIALSSRSTSRDIDHARDLGFTDFIPKFDRERLLNALAAAIPAATPCYLSSAEMAAA